MGKMGTDTKGTNADILSNDEEDVFFDKISDDAVEKAALGLGVAIPSPCLSLGLFSKCC